MHTLLMSPTANTILSGIIGFVLGAVAIAFWYGREGAKDMGKYSFDERDAFDFNSYQGPKIKSK